MADLHYRCLHCGTHTTSPVIAAEVFADTDQSGQYALDFLYRLVRCAKCSDISLLLTPQFDDYYDDVQSVYPAGPRSMSDAVPKTVQQCFEEARTCYHSRAYTAAAIMCRRTLETLALDRGVKERNLAASIKKLQEKGDIDQRLYDWCDELRVAGNSAAHDVEVSTSHLDAKDMNDLTEAIIDYVYVFQARYEEFKKRRSGPGD